jgi:hypothetical protein
MYWSRAGPSLFTLLGLFSVFRHWSPGATAQGIPCHYGYFQLTPGQLGVESD